MMFKSHLFFLGIFASCIFISFGCGSEAKFHSVYTYETTESPGPHHKKERELYSCEYEPYEGQEIYTCRKITPDQCFNH